MKTNSTRRTALTAAGIGVLGTAFGPGLRAADISPLEKANLQAVNDFCAAWPSRDPAKIMAFFADNCAYRMTETMEPSKGREAVTSRVAGLAPGVQGFEVLDSWARGPMVINERIDRFSSGDR